MEIDALRLEIDKLTKIVAQLQAESVNDAIDASKGNGEKKFRSSSLRGRFALVGSGTEFDGPLRAPHWSQGVKVRPKSQ
jgi:hypothetical protein